MTRQFSYLETQRERHVRAFDSLDARLTVRNERGRSVLEAVGDVEWSATRQLRILLLTADSDDIVVDLARVGYLDHHCLAVLARAHRYRRARGGGVRMVAPPRSTLAMMRVARAYDLPPVYATLAEALA